MVDRARRTGRAASSDPAVDDFVTSLLTASRVLVAVSAASLTGVEDSLTLTQFRALVVLRSRPEINLSGLADSLGVNSSTALRTFDRLLAAGLVTRSENPSDRREVTLGLTATGKQIVDRVTERRRSELAAIVRRMPAGRRGELVAALDAFTEAAGEPAVRSDPRLTW